MSRCAGDSRPGEGPFTTLFDVAGTMPPVDDKECVICYDAIGDHVMMPCGHGGYCGRCASDMCTGRSAPHDPAAGHVCPVCREPVEEVVRVHLGTSIGHWCSATCKLVVERCHSRGAPPAT